ncbi:P-loop containing nucleoside triphosphate hydrolase protein [Artomyces pyxidatus]|uniref:P-loop containing nucleoside triphosphate hydrolase protein n=1 Tax=Artomyces pyxidatus TaxID=48021 RepID=A0ACB8T1J5_9AGAM|nr:P-loop containing nucleoside triphosphate hydrolase protein [Artomyces pyxidatus]
MTPEQVTELKEAMKSLFRGKEPRDFQVEMVKAQEERRDALCQAATGSGKTAIAAGPYALEKNRGRVTFMVSPLIGLQNEMVGTFREDFNLAAVAVNSAHGGCTTDVLRDICQGKYQIVLVSPEMMLSRRFINDVLRNQELASRVYSVIIDEAHCISHWGASFRKKYGTIGMIRVFLPQSTPVIAVSASLTRRVTRDIVEKLQFSSNGYIYRNLGNDRPNVSIVVRAIHNTMGSYTDLNFLIPSNVKEATDLKKIWIYADNIETGGEIIDHLRTLLPPTLHTVIRPYNAVHGVEYRDAAMAGFRDGNIRILVCTDAAGMGCNIPDIDIVVQWKLPEKLSSFVQRAGRVARGPGRTGVAILLVEPAAYSVLVPESLPEQESSGSKKAGRKGKKRSVRGVKKKKTKEEKEYPRHHRMYLFLQATTCRREVLREVFENPQPTPTVPCCDICHPQLLDNTRPGPKPRASATRLSYHKPEEASLAIEESLQNWCENILVRDKHSRFFIPSCILPDEAVSKLARLKSLTPSTIEACLKPQWVYWAKYGEELTNLLIAVDRASPAAPECPQARSSTESLGDEEVENQRERRGSEDIAGDDLELAQGIDSTAAFAAADRVGALDADERPPVDPTRSTRPRSATASSSDVPSHSLHPTKRTRSK